MSVEKLTPN